MGTPQNSSFIWGLREGKGRCGFTGTQLKKKNPPLSRLSFSSEWSWSIYLVSEMEVKALLPSLMFHHTDSWLPDFCLCWLSHLQHCPPLGKTRTCSDQCMCQCQTVSLASKCPDLSFAQTSLSLLYFLAFLVSNTYSLRLALVFQTEMQSESLPFFLAVFCSEDSSVQSLICCYEGSKVSGSRTVGLESH